MKRERGRRAHRADVRASLLRCVAALGLVGLIAVGAAGAAGAVENRPAATGGHPRQTTPAAALAELSVSETTPRVVTPDGPPELVVTGRIHNVSDRNLSNVVVRLQRGEPVTSADAARAALDGTAPTDTAASPFVPVVESLAPGDSADFSVRAPLAGGDGTLGISQPGSYPLLVNANGQPDYGGDARLAATSMLLPVVGAPGGATASSSVSPSTTVLWPLVSTPKMVGRDTRGRAILADDELARSVGPGGRLFGLLQAIEDGVAPGSNLSRSLCFAIDPALLEAVEAMSAGYLVRSSSGEGPVEGAGGSTADVWLNKLRDVVSGRCVIALPYADADLVALTRSGMDDLRDLAFTRGAEIVERVLGGSKPLSSVVWPAEGVLDDATLSALAESGTSTLLLSPSGMEEATPGLLPTRVSGATVEPTALPIDPLVSRALRDTAATPGPQLGGGGAAAAALEPATPARDAVTDSLGVLLFRTTADANVTEASRLVVAPPRLWEQRPADHAAFLGGLERLFQLNLATPGWLVDQTDSPLPERATALTYPADVGSREIPAQVGGSVRRGTQRVTDFGSALTPDNSVDPNSRVQPEDLTDPVRLAYLGATSSSWRGNPTAANHRLSAANLSLDRLLARVQVNRPATPLSLAASDSPLPLAVSNRLPVGVRVQVLLRDSPGLDIPHAQEFDVPANSTRQRLIPAEVSRSGQFTVSAVLTTPGGTELGPPVRLLVSSTAYGTITVIITVVAGAALVLLSARRLVRRFRGAGGTPPPGEAGGERPSPTPDAGDRAGPRPGAPDQDDPPGPDDDRSGPSTTGRPPAGGPGTTATESDR
ncbi:DUF6049 family protein [Actinoalloteichus caeruleus]|uniref:Secreted protein n=1 Tax=Actinoalloteichus caeruleus DSM 43889 TaxID=1120930 RepID=A0ABT1JKF3_ACTCY|nr:hypothetical protein [Actinoalloteichus caeruleus DSM 43889]